MGVRMAGNVRELCFLLCFIATSLFNISVGFHPSSVSTGSLLDHNTKTHSTLTNTGIQKATALFLLDRGLTDDRLNPFQEFFDGDKENEMKFYEVIKEIITVSNEFQRTNKAVAKYSVNGEQIAEAHSFVSQTRREIKALFAGDLTDSIKTLTREKIGQCLFVIQSFYSNTNWPNIHGSTVYKDFGVPGRQLMSIAGSDQDTCKDCDLYTGSCTNNLMVQDVLTSGYRSGQDIVKQPLQQRRTTGKCSHGGKGDTSTNTPAKGGINKETAEEEYSPHHHLHNDASSAAIDATVTFLTDVETGILVDAGDEKFKIVFNLIRRKPHSLAFAIDVTGSMHDDIQGVIKFCVDMPNSLIGTQNEPLNYVLTTFSDPVDLGTELVTTDGYEMIAAIRGLSVSGGDDCPEYSITGTFNAVNLAKGNSVVYTFTDADAKDCSREDDLVELAKSKNISISYVLTRSSTCLITDELCSRKRRSVEAMEDHSYTGDKRINTNANAHPSRENRYDVTSHRQKRDTTNVYTRVAAATGGESFLVNKDEVADVLHTLFEKHFPSSMVLVDFEQRKSWDKDVINIPVDSFIELLKIKLTGLSEESDATLKNPSGIERKMLSYTDGSDIYTIVSRPVTGIWTLTRNRKVDWTVRVYAESPLYLTYTFLETESDGLTYISQGSPLAGINHTLQVSMPNVSVNHNITIALLNDSGSEEASLPVALSEFLNGLTGQTTVNLLPKNVYVQVQGIDNYGNAFRRTSELTASPVSVRLTLGYITGDLYVGKSHSIPYTLTNIGELNNTYTVNYTDDKGYHAVVTNTAEHFLASGLSVDGSFQITGNVDGEIIKYTVYVKDTSTGVVLQSLSRTVTFTSKMHPVCTIVQMNGNCSEEDLDINKCSNRNWLAQCNISFSGVSLRDVYLTNHDGSVTYSHGNVSSTTSPLTVAVQGTCCTPSVYVNAIDDEDYTTRCHLYYGDPHLTITVNIAESEPPLSEHAISATILVAIFTVLSVLLAVTAVKCIHSKYCKGENRVESDISYQEKTKNAYSKHNDISIFDITMEDGFTNLPPKYHGARF